MMGKKSLLIKVRESGLMKVDRKNNVSRKVRVNKKTTVKA